MQQGKKQRILIVDDEDYICRLMRMVLEKAGYEVLEAHTVPRGLELLREQIPDLVTVDLMMPDRDGLELLKEKAADPTIQAIPSLVVTAVGLQTGLERARELGARSALAKPFSQHQLIEAVAALLE